MSDITHLSSLGRAALALAQDFGWPVFPCVPRDKHPLTEAGFYDAATRPEQIAAWWDEHPNANIGLWPGPAQLLVLDVDGPDGDAAARAAGAYSEPTLEAITRRGVHRYFRLPSGVTIGNVARTELDVRSAKGYVLAPPSVHESGHVYAWRGDLDAIADVPPSLLQALQTPARTTRRRTTPAPSSPAEPIMSLDRFTERRVVAYTDCVGYGLSDGRKSAAYRLACFYRFDVGLVEDLAWRCLSLWNDSNSPPLDAEKLTEIFVNANRYARGAA